MTHKQRHQWDIHRPRRLYQNKYEPSPTSTPVVVSRSHNQLSISIPLPYTITPPPEPRSWKEHIKTRPPWEQHFLTKVKIPNPPALTAAIVTPSQIPILVVSDGSFKSPYGAFSWEIEQDQTTLATCTGPVGGSPVTTFRTECYAILTWTTFLLEYISYTNTQPSAALTPYSDSEKAIQTTSSEFTTLFQHKPIRPDYDISTALNAQFTILSMVWPLLHPIAHIRAHQLPPFPNRQTHLLHTIDISAKQTRRQTRARFSEPLPHCSAYLRDKTGIITSKEMNICRWKWRNELLIKWYADNFRIPLTTSRRIHWESYALTKEKLTPKLRRFSIKLTIGWLPVGTRLHYYGNEIDTCHLCPAQETPQHLFRCAHRIPFFLERHTALQSFLHQINTPEDIKTRCHTEFCPGHSNPQT